MAVAPDSSKYLAKASANKSVGVAVSEFESGAVILERFEGSASERLIVAVYHILVSTVFPPAALYIASKPVDCMPLILLAASKLSEPVGDGERMRFPTILIFPVKAVASKLAGIKLPRLMPLSVENIHGCMSVSTVISQG